MTDVFRLDAREWECSVGQVIPSIYIEFVVIVCVWGMGGGMWGGWVGVRCAFVFTENREL